MVFHVLHNGIIDKKHVKKMGVTIWEFAWLVDRVTQETQVGGERWGKVLGGKPITYKDMGDALGYDERTVTRHIDQLRKEGYIKMTRTPYGQSFWIRNSSKFRVKPVDKSSKRPDKSVTPDLTNLSTRPDKSVVSNIRHNKDITVDTKGLEISVYKKMVKCIGDSSESIQYPDAYLKSLIEKWGVGPVNKLYKYNVSFHDWGSHLKEWGGQKGVLHGTRIGTLI